MNVVDSCGWLEFFAKGGNSEFFAIPIRDTAQLVVPTISVYEVYKRVEQHAGEAQAKRHVTLMNQAHVVDLSADLAMRAARLSAELRLPMADSVMLATAQAHGATLWTQDSDFEGIEGVRYIARHS